MFPPAALFLPKNFIGFQQIRLYKDVSFLLVFFSFFSSDFYSQLFPVKHSHIAYGHILTRFTFFFSFPVLTYTLWRPYGRKSQNTGHPADAADAAIGPHRPPSAHTVRRQPRARFFRAVPTRTYLPTHVHVYTRTRYYHNVFDVSRVYVYVITCIGLQWNTDIYKDDRKKLEKARQSRKTVRHTSLVFFFFFFFGSFGTGSDSTHTHVYIGIQNNMYVYMYPIYNLQYTYTRASPYVYVLS